MKCSGISASIVLAIASLAVFDKVSCCELSWTRYDEHCYRIFPKEVTRYTARLKCILEGSDLVSISNVTVLDFLAQHIAHSNKSKFWVGLERNTDENRLVWFDGTRGVENQSWVKVPEAKEYTGLLIGSGCFAYDGALVVKESCYNSYPYICGHHVSNVKTRARCHWSADPTHSFVGDYTGDCLFRTPSLTTRNRTEETCKQFGGHVRDFDRVILDGLSSFFSHKVLSNDGSRYWTGFTWNGTHMIGSDGDAVFSGMPVNVVTGNGSCITVEFNLTDALEPIFYRQDCDDKVYVVCGIKAGEPEKTTTVTPAIPLRQDRPLMDSPEASCPEGYNWKTHRSSDYCYWETSFETDQLSWHDAENFCQSYGGHLISLHSVDEEKIGLSFQYGSLAHPYWVGLYLDPETETYKWTDGSPMDYKNWAPGHPNHKDKQLRCVAMEAQEKHWVSSLCGILSWFVCKVPKKSYHPVVSIPTPTPLESCDKDLEKSQKSSFYFRGACYFTVDEAYSWHRAKQYCENQGSSLVSIHSTEEIGFLLRLLHESAVETNRVWIGLNSFGSDGTFRWTDWTAVDFTFFSDNEPNNYQNQEKCCNMYTRNGQWNDENCNAALSFVCKRFNETYVTTEIPSTLDPRIGNCKKGWIEHLDRCYYIGGKREKDRVNWTEALDICQKHGGSLTSVRDEKDQNFLSYLLQILGLDAWIGFHDTIQSGVYFWVDNSEVKYTNWAPGEPSFFGILEDCVKMVYDHLDSGVWKDEECHHKIGYICQADKDPKLPSPASDRGVNCVHPEGWLKLDTMCFKMFEGNPLTWQQAESACQKDGGHLVSVSDQKVKAVVAHLATEVNQPFFIGMKYDKDTQRIKWLNDFPVTLTNWEKNEPSNLEDDTCFASTSEGYWKKSSCNEKMPYVCQISTGTPKKPKQYTGECPPSSRLWVSGTGSFCYIVDNDFSADWFTANLMCFRYGSHLLSIHSIEEIENLKKLMKPGIRSIFLGLMRNRKGGFTWTDDSPVDFVNWQEQEPANSEDQCVEMMIDTMKWRVVPCISKKNFVCKDRKGTLVKEEPQTAEFLSAEGGMSTAAICAVVFSILVGVVLIAAAAVYLRRSNKGTPFRRHVRDQSVSFENALYNVGSASMEFHDENKS